MDALNMPRKIKATRQLQFPYTYSSQSVDSIKKLRITKNETVFRSGTAEMFRQEIGLSVELDKTVLFENFPPDSTRPLVPASVFCVICRQIACQNKRTERIWKQTPKTKLLIT